MPALKDNIDRSMVGALSAELTAAWSGFPAAAFTTQAGRDLEALELKDRIRQVAGALRDALPTEVAAVAAVVDAALTSPSFDGWMVWPVAEMLGELAPADPNAALPLMARFTHRSSCEFAIRPCIEEHPEVTFRHLERWVTHQDEHVRRLVSEGTRPRLPWGRRLRALQRDPRPAIALLDRLRDDDAEYVRRSVANHLGDIVKDHPDLAIATARRWQAEGGRHVEGVIRHGLRTLVKAGDPAALSLLGYDPDAPVVLRSVTVDPVHLEIGDRASIEVELTTDGDAPVPVIVEYLVHFVGARGPRKAKAFRLADRVLDPGEVSRIRRNHRFDHVSIRTLHPGEHLIEVQVNGRVLGSGRVVLSTGPVTSR